MMRLGDKITSIDQCKELLKEVLCEINKQFEREFQHRARWIADEEEICRIHYEVSMAYERAIKPYRDKYVEIINLMPPAPIIISRDSVDIGEAPASPKS